MRKARQQAGFTLIEILIVIVIISILAGLSFPAYRGIQNSGRRKQATAEIKLFTLKLNDFRLDYGFLPTATFIGGTPPQSVREPGTYDADPSADPYLKSSRVLFLALTGRTSYNDTDSKGRDYLNPARKNVGEPESSGGEVFADERDTYEAHPFTSGSYLLDPWGNPYGFYNDPDNSKWKSFHNPSGFDIWSTADQTESTQAGRSKWISNWLK